MKKNLSLIISFIGIVSIAGGLLLIKTLENPNEFILTLSYICIGVGCGVLGHGMELKGRIREALIKMILDFDIPLETEE